MTVPPKEALQGIMFQSNLLALSAAVEMAGQGGSQTVAATAAAELQHLARAARQAAGLIEDGAAPAPPNSQPFSG